MAGPLGVALLGFAAAAIPIRRRLRRALEDEPEAMRRLGWPIRLMQVFFTRYVQQWIDVTGLENLPSGSYLVAANHAYHSGVDGYLLGHLIATHARRVPRILITAEHRNWMVQAQRQVLHHYGIALLVPDDSHGRQHTGLSDQVAAYLRAGNDHTVIFFPAGRAVADPALQLRDWSTGAVVAAAKSGCPVVPVAVGGLRLDWTPETVVLAALQAGGTEPPFHFQVHIGKPLEPSGDAHADLERLQSAIAELMQGIPGLLPRPGESDAGFGKLTLRDGRTLAYMDRGPRDGTPVLYFHGFQGSRLEREPGLEETLTQLKVRMIAPDRPGIGLSTPLRGRTLTAWVSDAQELTEHLLGPGTPFSILGFSAGATYALACGPLPGLRAMALVSGMGLPYQISGWWQYSHDAWRILLSAKLANFRAGQFLEEEKKQRDRIYGQWESYFADLKRSLVADDQRVLSLPGMEELFKESRRESYAQCPGCMLQDVQALYSDPRIEPARLAACAVQLYHGSDDNVVPVGVARDLHARLPTSRLVEMPGCGHYFIEDEGQMKHILQELLMAHAQ